MLSTQKVLKNWLLDSHIEKFTMSDLETLPSYGREHFDFYRNNETYVREWRRMKNGQNSFEIEDDYTTAIIKNITVTKKYYVWAIKRTKKE